MLRVVKISSVVPRVPSRQVEISSQPPVPSRSTLPSTTSTKEIDIIPRAPQMLFPPKKNELLVYEGANPMMGSIL